MLVFLQQLLGIGLPAVLNEISRAMQVRADAKTEQERIAADERIETLTAKKEIILQAQKDRVERIMRVLFALPFVAYLWKLLIWDKLLGWGVTDPLSPTLEYILWTVLGGYFLPVTINTIRGKK